MAVEFDGGVVIGADSRTTTGYDDISRGLKENEENMENLKIYINVCVYVCMYTY